MREQFLEKMQDLCQTMGNFKLLGQSLAEFRANAQTVHGASSAPLEARLAEEYIALAKNKKALTVIRNLLYLGFAIGAMLKVCLSTAHCSLLNRLTVAIFSRATSQFLMTLA
jgi:hypothetical protein